MELHHFTDYKKNTKKKSRGVECATTIGQRTNLPYIQINCSLRQLSSQRQFFHIEMYFRFMTKWMQHDYINNHPSALDQQWIRQLQNMIQINQTKCIKWVNITQILDRICWNNHSMIIQSKTIHTDMNFYFLMRPMEQHQVVAFFLSQSSKKVIVAPQVAGSMANSSYLIQWE